MKKFLSLFLAVYCLFGCVQQSDIEDLQKQIDNLKAGEIATMSAQITGIHASLGELQNVDTELRGLIETLQEDLSALDGKVDEKYEAVQGEHDALSSAEEALGQRISDLKNYCDQQDNGVRDWVSLTFATLEQHSAVLNEIATIKIRLGQLENALTSLDTTLSQKISDAEARVMSAIETSETSIKGWVNEQLAGYYTIAQADAKLKLLEDAYKDADESMAEDLSTLRGDLTTAVTNLTSAYQTAISDAITTNNGVINAKIASDIQAATSALQTQIDAITTRITSLESRISALEATVAELVGMIQSAVVVPDYSDGSVCFLPGKNELTFDILPQGLAASLAEAGPEVFSIKVVYTKTKAHEYETIPVIRTVAEGDAIVVSLSGEALVDEFYSGGISANASLIIHSGQNYYQTIYFPLHSSCTMPEIIDLGLSVKWASLNLGASAPEEYGEYYAWGETETKDSYTWETYEFSTNKTGPYSKYNTKTSYGMVDNKIVLETGIDGDDAASKKLGGNWRMPTDAELTELRENCTWTWTTQNGVDGMLVTAANNNSIFLPATGYIEDAELTYAGTIGYYWSSSLDPDYPHDAWRIYFNSDNIIRLDGNRYHAFCIRPVYDDRASSQYVDLGLSVKWATCNLCEDGFVSSPEEYGDYYAWGETTTKANYTWSTYEFGTSSSGPFSKYNTESSYGNVDNKTTLEMTDDVARQKLGGKWRIPTRSEFKELIDNCIVEWTTLNEVYGRKFTSKITGNTNKSIFLPATGYRYGLPTSPFYAESRGYYWTSSLYPGICRNAYFVLFDSSNTNISSYDRCDGYSVRPVAD